MIAQESGEILRQDSRVEIDALVLISSDLASDRDCCMSR